MDNFRIKKLLNTRHPPHTQKAKGLWVLSRKSQFNQFNIPQSVYLGINIEGVLCNKPVQISSGRSSVCSRPAAHEGMCAVEGLEGWPFSSIAGVFGRPCPETPRHGFIDSERVSGLDETIRLFQRALDVDPRSEILLMPYIDCSSSAIWIPESGSLTIGRGNDGATAGRNSYLLPVAQIKATDSFKKFKSDCGIPDDKHLYAELVSDRNGGVTIVQARAGEPTPQGVTEYIPREQTVEHVIEITEPYDWAEHEALCVALANSTTVVFHHRGGQITCHAAMHCRTNSIPYLIRDEVLVGDTIYPPVVAPVPHDYIEFIGGIQLSECSADVSNALRVAIGILHNSIPLEYSEHYSRLIGYSLGWIYRAAALACLGEARHYKTPQGTKNGMLGTTSRAGVYAKGVELTNAQLATKLASFSHKFVHYSAWSGGYGGWKWYLALVQALKLWNSISNMQIQTAVGEASKLLNMAHNGGWLLNKFCEQSIMSQAAEQSGEFLAATSNSILKLLEARPEVTPGKTVKPRKTRASHKWRITASKTESGAIKLRVNDLDWFPMMPSSAFKSAMQDTFENV